MAENTIDYFAELKEKSKVNGSVRDAFQKTWLEYVHEHGFDAKAEKNLLTCFALKKFEPFMMYIGELENKQDMLKKLIAAENFMSIRDNALKMTCDLLARVINTYPEFTDIIASLLKRFEALAHAKGSNEPTANLMVIYQKYFVNMLKANVVFPVWEDLGLLPMLVDSIKSYMQLGIISDRPKFNSKPCLKALKEWIARDEHVSQVQPGESVDSPVVPEKKEPKVITVSPQKKDDSTDKVEKTAGTKTADAPVSKDKDKDKTVPVTIDTIFSDLKAYAKQVEKSTHNFVNELKKADDEIASLKNELMKVRSDRDVFQESNAKKMEKISCLIEEQKVLSVKCAELEKQLEDEHVETESLKSLVKIMESKNENSQSENLNRISAELATFYEDFIAAKDEEMSLDMGEALKDQLSEIYKILGEHGLHFN